MNSEEKKEKYIHPQRRKQLSKNDSNQNLSLTNHAQLRKKQRNISDKKIQLAVESGSTVAGETATTFIDQSTVAVVSNDKKHVVTVIENRRNTRFDVTRSVKNKEERLLEKIHRFEKNDHLLCELAELYLSGDLGNRDVKKAYELLFDAQKQNNSHAMCLIAGMYEDGAFGQVDLEQWEFWLKKAADYGNKYANAMIGQTYLARYLRLSEEEKLSDTGQKMMQEVMSFLNKSAKKGSTRAMWQLAEILEEGWGCEKNIKEALKIYSKAAKTGSPASLIKLQEHVDKGNFTEEEFEAILDKASDVVGRNSSALAVDIAYQQIEGELGKKPDRGVKMLEMAARNNNPDAILALARCLRDGAGCEINIKKSTRLFHMLKGKYLAAIKNGNVSSLFNLAELYLDGEFPRSQTDVGAHLLLQAEKLLIDAASSASLTAMEFLANAYFKGKLGDIDPSNGFPWMEKVVAFREKSALEQNNIIEAFRLKELFLNKKTPLKNYQKAKQWLIFLIEKKSNGALEELFLLYLYGKLTKKVGQGEGIFSISELKLIKKLAIEDENRLALLFLVVLNKGGLTIEEEIIIKFYDNKSDFESHLIEKAKENNASVALILANLYRSLSFFSNSENQAMLFFILAACSRTNMFFIHSTAEKEFKRLFDIKLKSLEEKNIIFLTMLKLSNEIENRSPFRLGRLLGDAYFKGTLTECNIEEAIRWYTKAAELENQRAMYQLGVIYYSVAEFCDIQKSVDWFKQCVNSVTIGYLYNLRKSNDLPEILKETLDFELMKYSKGYVLSERSAEEMYDFGKQFQQGTVIAPKDICRSAFWFRKAAGRGHTEASFELGTLFESGQLGKNVKPVAIRYFKQAGRKGHTGAVRQMVSIFNEGILVPANREKAQKLERKFLKT